MGVPVETHGSHGLSKTSKEWLPCSAPLVPKVISPGSFHLLYEGASITLAQYPFFISNHLLIPIQMIPSVSPPNNSGHQLSPSLPHSPGPVPFVVGTTRGPAKWTSSHSSFCSFLWVLHSIVLKTLLAISLHSLLLSRGWAKSWARPKNQHDPTTVCTLGLPWVVPYSRFQHQPRGLVFKVCLTDQPLHKMQILPGRPLIQVRQPSPIKCHFLKQAFPNLLA